MVYIHSKIDYHRTEPGDSQGIFEGERNAPHDRGNPLPRFSGRDEEHSCLSMKQ
jgi:hypothetical protein